MHGKTHDNLRTIRPLKAGVIADFNAAEQMIRGMIKMINSKHFAINSNGAALLVFHFLQS